MIRRYRLLTVLLAVPILTLFGTLTIGTIFSGPNSKDILGISLTRPALAYSASEFPDPNIGMSGYMKFSPGSIDLDTLTRSRFEQLTHAGDNYVIGYYLVPRNYGYFDGTGVRGERSFVRVYLYADTDGWFMSYLQDDALTAEIIHRSQTDPDPLTVLQRALMMASSQAGIPVTQTSPMTYFHWQYPDATHMALTRKDTNGNLYFAIPMNAMLYDASAAVSCGRSYPIVFGEVMTDECDVAGEYGIVSVPLLGSLPLGRSVTNSGDVSELGISKPNIVSDAGPDLGAVHTHILTDTTRGYYYSLNGYATSGPYWDGFAFLYSMP